MIKETILSRSLRLMFSSGIVLGLSVGSIAQAQDAPETSTPQPQPEAAQMQRVEITGSSIKRAQVEGALPVQTVTRAEIEKLGATSVEQLLSTLSANSFVGGQTVSNVNSSISYGESTASLRGLGANKTLILVNGRRLANYATDGTAVDINAIPLASVDRVEILKDGASGVYGSDAIGGVINFIMRKNVTGVELNAYTGTTKDGGGAVNKAGLLAGLGDYDADRYNVMLSLDVGKDSSIQASQRSYAGNSWLNSGLYDSSATPSGALRTFDPTTTATAGVVPHSLASQGAGIGNPLSPNNCAQNGSAFDANLNTCRYNFAPLAPLTPEVKRLNIAPSFRFKVSENTEFFAEGFYSRQEQTISQQPSPYSVSFLASDPAFATKNIYPAIILSPSNPNYPGAFIAAANPAAAGQPVTVSYRAFDGGGRVQKDVATQAHLVTGLRGMAKGFDYDVAYVHNASSVTNSTERGFQVQTALVSLLSNNNAFNPYAQTQSPALAAQIYGTNYNGQMVTSTLTTDALDAKVSGELYKLPGGMLTFALGASTRNEKMDFDPSLVFQTGDVSGYGLQALPLTASRHSNSIFGELDIPILTSLEADLAVRTDRYPNMSSTNPKLSLRFQPTAQVLLRASYGTGFRAPALPELYNQQVIATTASFKDPITGVQNQYAQVTGGNPNLKPEKSEQSSIGLVLDISKNMSLSVDYWKIRVKDLITTLTPQAEVLQAAANNPAYVGLVKRDSANNITSISALNLNAGGMSTAGLDIDYRWAFAKTLDYGNFGVHLNGTYINKFDEVLPDGTIQHNVAATIDGDGNPLNLVQNGGIISRWRHAATLDWAKGPYGVSLTQNFQTGYYDNARADSATGTDAQHVGAFTTWDMQASYTGIKNLTLRAGLKNMFNRLPPLAITLGQYTQGGFDPSYYDAHGMFGYVSASYKF